MASVFSQIQSTRIKAGRDEVYVATMPLRATKGPPQLLMSAAYSLNLWDLQHLFVIIKPSSPTLSEVPLFISFSWILIFFLWVLLHFYICSWFFHSNLSNSKLNLPFKPSNEFLFFFLSRKREQGKFK